MVVEMAQVKVVLLMLLRTLYLWFLLLVPTLMLLMCKMVLAMVAQRVLKFDGLLLGTLATRARRRGRWRLTPRKQICRSPQ